MARNAQLLQSMHDRFFSGLKCASEVYMFPDPDIFAMHKVAVEMEQFGKLVMSPESASLRNIFFAERQALKVKGNTAKPTAIKKVGIIGAGLMGGGIAMNFLKKNIPVVIKDAKKEWLDAGVGTIKKNYDITV